MVLPHIAVLTNRGRQRTENQDAVLALRFGDGQQMLLAIADGLGGLANGAVASRHALQRIRQALVTLDSESPIERIVAALGNANSEFVQAAEGDSQKTMGTTAVGLLFNSAGVLSYNIGDSRAYRLRDGVLQQLTQDHSVGADLVRQGLLTPDELSSDPRRNQLTRCVGVEPDFEPDIVGPAPVASRDRYLVCSDGLYGPLREEEIARLVEAAPDPLSACARLIDAANAAGGPDNISAGLAFFE